MSTDSTELVNLKIKSIEDNLNLIMSKFYDIKIKPNMSNSENIQPDVIDKRKYLLKILKEKFQDVFSCFKNHNFVTQTNFVDQTNFEPLIDSYNKIFRFLKKKENFRPFIAEKSKMFIDMIFKCLLDINYLLFDFYILMYSKNVYPIIKFKQVDNPDEVHCELKIK